MDIGEMRKLARAVLTPAAKSSSEVYDRLRRCLARERLAPEEYAREHHLTQRSYRVLKTAYQRGLATSILSALTERDRAQQEGEEALARAARERATILARALAACEPDPSRTRFGAGVLRRRAAYQGPRSRGRSKRVGLARLAKDRPSWRQDLVAEIYRVAGAQVGDAVALMALCGARPAELCAPLGALVETSPNLVAISILGAKIGDKAGQAARRWDIEQVPHDLAPVLARLRRSTIERGGKLGVKLASTRSLRRAVTTAARHLALKRVSAYSLRHAAKNDLAASGLPPSDIAKAMGHASCRTAEAYGWRKGGSAGGYRIKVVAAREPRSHDRSLHLGVTAPAPRVSLAQ